MNKKFVIITGGSSGLGLHLAKALFVNGGFSLILACRNEKKAEKAVKKVKNCSIPINKINLFRSVQWLKIDLSDIKSIYNFVNCLLKICNREEVEILVNNAGVMYHPYKLSKNNLEIHFATNYLGHFVLTNSLLENELISNNGRIINITSGYYHKASSIPNVGVLTAEEPIGGRKPEEYYAISKLAVILHIFGLNIRLRAEGKKIKAVVVQPGFVKGTELMRHLNPLLRFFAAPFIWFYAQNLDQGISDILHCALAPAKEIKSGALYFQHKIVTYDEELINLDAAEELWHVALHFLEKE